MNQGAVQSSPVQQMVAVGCPNWWSVNNMRPPPLHHQHHSFSAAPPHQHHFPHQLVPSQLMNNIAANSSWTEFNQDLPESWSQLLLGGLIGEGDKPDLSHKKLEIWEQQLLNQTSISADHVKQEDDSSSSYSGYGHGNVVELMANLKPMNYWSHHQMASASLSPKSCITTLSNNMLDFSPKSSEVKHPAQKDPQSECNSTATGGAAKKARIQPSSSQSTFKVRKEKLGDRITALHQLVSPFGKTDTASVLLEAIGYIKFLQSQIEALSQPYLDSGSGNKNNMRQQHPVQGERTCLFPEDPGQLVNEKCIKRKAISDRLEYDEEGKKDLRSRGLCLVPISSTLHVGSDNGADYWASAFGGNFR